MKHLCVATYILIALHFIRLAVRRATVEQMFNIPDDTPLPPPDGCEYKVVLFYKYNSVLRAMEFYYEDTEKTGALYSVIRSKYPSSYINDTIYTLSAKDNLHDLFHNNDMFAAALPRLTQNSMTLTFRERLSVRDYIMQRSNTNFDKHRDIKIC